MTSVDSRGAPEPDAEATTTIRIAAAGDIHCSATDREAPMRAFAEVDGTVDLILLAGDLTTHGQPAQAQVLADACADLDTPVIAVLGNHDWHCGQRDEVVTALTESGIVVLERSSTVCRVRDVDVGIVGVKGFVGGFPGSYLPDFGEPSLRAVYAEASAEVEALERGLREISTCPVRIALLHYAPTSETLVGEPESIWAFLGTDRLAPPILEHAPDLVLHGHAHRGAFEGHLDRVPVYNVSVPVIRRDFWMFEIAAAERPRSPVH